MRRFLPFALLLSCAHGPRPVQPEQWLELQTEHFVLRTDLAPRDAHRMAADLEVVRAALLAAGWHSPRISKARTQVIVLADDRELQEYAAQGIGGFVSGDAFGEPIMVVSGSQDAEDQRFLKHELTHVISNQFLVRNPRWVSEGLACYLEMLRFDRKQGQIAVGEMPADRLQYLRDSPVPSYWSIIETGREAEQMSVHEGWAFETGAWILVHWLVDVRGPSFDDFLSRLSLGEDQFHAFAKVFPDLHEATIKAGIATYFKTPGLVRIYRADAPHWAGQVGERTLPAGEVYAILADLQRISPGYAPTPERVSRKTTLIAQALQADPGNPLAVKLSDSADAAAATAAHPDDWRAWLVFADKNSNDLAALRTAHRLAPENPVVLARLSWAEAAHGDRETALKYAMRAVEIAPGRSEPLVVLGTVLADSGRCEEGERYVLRAFDVLPDGADQNAIASLKQTQRAIEDHCRKLGMDRTERRVLRRPTGCDPAGPRFGRRDKAKGKLSAEIVVSPDGKVGEVQVKGDANASAVATVKKYLRSCKYEPVLEDGKPREARWQVDFTVDR